MVAEFADKLLVLLASIQVAGQDRQRGVGRAKLHERVELTIQRPQSEGEPSGFRLPLLGILQSRGHLAAL